MKQKQKTLGRVAADVFWNCKNSSIVWERLARAVVREHEKRKGVCVCGYWKRFGVSSFVDKWVYCPKCGKRIKVGGK